MKNPMQGRRSLVFPKVWQPGADCKYTHMVFGPKSPSGTAVELDPSVGSFWSRKGVGDTWQVPARLGGVVEDSGAVPPYGWASSTRRRRSDARGHSQHNRAPRYLNPRRGKSLSGENGKNQKLLYSVITVNSRRLGEREQKDQVSLVSRV